MNERLRESLEACRHGTDDLSLPDMADLARAVAESGEWRRALENVQQADQAISRALQDVAIPAGLEARLLAAVAAEVSAPVAADPSGASTPRSSRRAWMVLAAAVAASVMLAAWGVQHWRRPAVLEPENLGFEALAWSQTLPDDWRDLEEANELNRPVDRQVRYAPRGWQPLATPHDSATVVYDLTGRRGTALLFVLAPTAVPSNLSTAAVRVPSTGGWGAAAWKNGDFVYVLLVEERRQKLDDYLASPATEIVLAPPAAATRPTS